MENDIKFYICPFCFQVCETKQECHQHEMIVCNSGQIGDERRRPVTDHQGKIMSRAPRWYIEAIGLKFDEMR
jgi:hypothetical protein